VSDTTSTVHREAREIAPALIDTGGNVRALDPEHVSALAGSMALRGLVVPIAVRALDGGRYQLVAGEHRLAAARQLGWTSIAAVVGPDGDGASGDQGAENITSCRHRHEHLYAEGDGMPTWVRKVPQSAGRPGVRSS
jgi:ParB/RepB/Spo0J family partition protein